MSVAVVYSRANSGITSPLVTVESHLSNGLPSFSIVGLAETTVKESKDRVRSAIVNSQFQFPCKRITINLAPADLRKEGGRFDLPIALGILAASAQLPSPALLDYEFAGELALSGNLRPFNGCLPFAISSHLHKKTLIVPTDNAAEAALPSNGQGVLAASHLLEVCAHLKREQLLLAPQPASTTNAIVNMPDLNQVCGQHLAKRALEIAAAGEHSLLMIGPPGTGKTMLATRLASILPPLTTEQALEVAAIHSVSTLGFNSNQYRLRPFRAPHHSASATALVGGGSIPRPGEVSLANHGILFLDELPEFNRNVLEVLREPLESGHITISRAARQAHYPAQFQLIAAMNPCPCGYLGNQEHACQCTANQVNRYHRKLSGPLLDRIDMHIEVGALPARALTESTTASSESSATVRQRVIKAREQQLQRQGLANRRLQGKALSQSCKLNAKSSTFIEHAMQKLTISARSYHSILKMARTIADLAGEPNIEREHLSEALGYRRYDRLLSFTTGNY